MSSKKQIQQIKKNKIKSNRTKLCPLNSTDTIAADTKIIDLDTISTSINTTDNINSNISVSDNDKSLELSLTPTINIRKPSNDEKGVLMLSRLPKPLEFMPNSKIMSLLDHDKSSGFTVDDNELDSIQWKLESVISSIFELKSMIKNNHQSISSIKLANYQQHEITKSPELSLVQSKAMKEILPVNECCEIKDEIDVSSELTESSLESAEQISKPDESFWAHVKPYLAHVSKDDLNWLKDLVKSYDANLDPIPPLNEHYTKVWIREKLTTQNNQSSDNSQLSKSIQQISPNVIELLNKIDHITHNSSESTLIFQRIVSALREHELMSQKNNSKENMEYECIEDKSQDISNFCKQFYKEKNINNQLLNLGLAGHYSKPVYPSSVSKSDTDDEILEELIKCDTTLNKLRESNKHDLTKLFQKCSLDYNKQKIKNKINKVNIKILKFKKRSNKNFKKKKNTEVIKENNQLRLLLNKRNKYLLELSELVDSKISDPNTPDDPSSSDEESINI